MRLLMSDVRSGVDAPRERNPSIEDILGITPDKIKVLHDVVAYDFWPLCRSHGDVLKMIADDDQMSDTEKTYCTFQVTKQIYSVAQKPELKTVIESVRGRLGR